MELPDANDLVRSLHQTAEAKISVQNYQTLRNFLVESVVREYHFFTIRIKNGEEVPAQVSFTAAFVMDETTEFVEILGRIRDEFREKHYCMQTLVAPRLDLVGLENTNQIAINFAKVIKDATVQCCGEYNGEITIHNELLRKNISEIQNVVFVKIWKDTVRN